MNLGRRAEAPPRLSVILPTHNRAALLAAALESLRHQTLPSSDFEVIVVDDGCTDDTCATIRSSELSCVRVIESAGRGLHAGRHSGLEAARADILVYADDDIEALPTWLESIDHAFRDPAVVLVGGNNLPRFCVPPPPWLLRLWQRRHPTLPGRALPMLSVLELEGGERDLPASYVWGCNFAIRKHTLRAAGGFHPDGMPPELLHLRGDGESHVSRYVATQRLRCRFHPGASVHHKITADRMTFAYFRDRGFRQGISQSYSDLRAGAAAARFCSIRPGLHWLGAALGRLVARDPEVHRAELAYASGLAAGYAHHHCLYWKSAELRAWVHRKTYLEGK